MRTQQEILSRFQEVTDLFDIQQIELICFLEFEFAKLFLRKGFVKNVEAGEEVWGFHTDPKKLILKYLDFAYEKAEDKIELSIWRSMLHFKTWIWLDDEKFYNEVIDLIDNYTDYGLPALDKIAEHYGYVRS